ncbi:MAG: CPBP family intramembrane glutamic endopeptidase [Pseudomonadota bacterium]
MKLLLSVLQSLAFFLLFALIAFPFVMLWSNFAASNLPEIADGPIEQLPIEIISAASAFTAVWLFGLLAKSVRLESLGLRHRSGAQFALAGLIIGIALVVLILVTLYVLGVLALNPKYRIEVNLEVIALTAGVTANVIAQDVIFFGFMLTLIRKNAPEALAVPVLSLLFVGAHAGVFAEPWPIWGIGSANLFLAGVMLSLAFLRSQTLWLGFGIHTGWNLTQALASLAVTGRSIGVGEPPFSLAGPPLLTGGDVGIEASVVSIPAVLLGIVIIIIFFKKNPQKNSEPI